MNYFRKKTPSQIFDYVLYTTTTFYLVGALESNWSFDLRRTLFLKLLTWHCLISFHWCWNISNNYFQIFATIKVQIKLQNWQNSCKYAYCKLFSGLLSFKFFKFQALIVNHFRSDLYLKCCTVFWIRFWKWVRNVSFIFRSVLRTPSSI